MHFTDRLIHSLFSALLFTACADDRKGDGSFDRETVRAEVTKTLHSYYDAIRRDGLTAEFRYLDSSADFFWVPPGYGGPISFDSVRILLLATAPALRTIDNRWNALLVQPINNETATYSGTIHSTITDTSGTTTTMLMKETGVLVKRKDGWKLVSGQTVSISPGKTDTLPR